VVTASPRTSCDELANLHRRHRKHPTFELLRAVHCFTVISGINDAIRFAASRLATTGSMAL